MKRMIGLVLLAMGTTAVLHVLVFLVPSYFLDGSLSLVRIVAGDEPTSTKYQLNQVGMIWCAAAIGIYGLLVAWILVGAQGVRWRDAASAASALAMLSTMYLAVIDPGFLLTILPEALANQYSEFAKKYVGVLYQVYWEWSFWRYLPFFALAHALMGFGACWLVVKRSIIFHKG